MKDPTHCSDCGGPLKGHEARIPVAGLRVHKRDVPCGNFCDNLLCPEHGLMS